MASRWRLSALLLGTVFSVPSGALETSGYAGFESRFFNHAPRFPEQLRSQFSAVAQVEFYHEWDDGQQSILFVPFARLDSADPRRTHADIRELFWQRIGGGWELRIGLAKVFWGVTESRHLVDIINQTDAVEDLDGEDKLGQPMVNLALVRDWGAVNLYLMPWFRDRSFAGTAGRMRPPIKVTDDSHDFESNLGRHHPDVAIRWAHSIGSWDIGLSHFYGNGREPELLPRLSPGVTELVPKYHLIHQSGLDAQLTQEAWLWKLEAIRRSGQGKPFVAVSGGFEYTLYGLFESAADLGLLAEYHYDERGRSGSVLQDDVFAGFRLTLNDAQSTELLAGVIIDRDLGSRVFNVEASRRFGDAWRLELNARWWNHISSRDPQSALRDDSHVQLSVLRYF